MGVGRKNCKRCGRWRHLVDFRWRWRRSRLKQDRQRSEAKRPRSDKPYIDTVCSYCRREAERNRYHSKSIEERRIIGIRANRNRRKREIRLNDDILLAQAEIKKLRVQMGVDRKLVPLLPFRLWLVEQQRILGTARAVARMIGYDEEQVRRWMNGYLWEAGRPIPINSIHLEIVDNSLVAAGQQHRLGELYPIKDIEEFDDAA